MLDWLFESARFSLAGGALGVAWWLGVNAAAFATGGADGALVLFQPIHGRRGADRGLVGGVCGRDRRRRRPLVALAITALREGDVVKRVTMPTTCPACSQGLEVLRLGCGACGTAVEGRFATGRLGRLNKAQLEFVETFLDCRGKIKDVEQALGISYPTVVARLDEAVAAMGAPGAMDATTDNGKGERAPKDRARHAEVLGALERGEITAAEAASRLRAHRSGGR